MCGIIGVSVRKPNEKVLDIVRNLFLQSMIRGKHATGVTFLKNGKLHTIKEPVPANVFMEKYNVEDWIDDTGNLCFIGHVRYSTSDLRYNQPMASDKLAIVHNGVISQEPPETWEKTFGYKTETKNDSELVLRCIEANDNPLFKFPDASMAVCKIDDTGTISIFRNGERPLYYSYLMEFGHVAASTKDILTRSGVKNPRRVSMNSLVMFEPIEQNGYFNYSLCMYPNKFNKKDLQC